MMCMMPIIKSGNYIPVGTRSKYDIMEEELLTPEYIIEQKDKLTDQELLELIYTYGSQRRNLGSELASDDY